MKVRKYTVNDIDAIVMLLKELCRSEEERASINKDTVQQHLQEMDKNNKNYENYVVEVETKVVGFMSILYYISVFHKTGTAQINELVVSEQHRNKDIGEKLLQYGIKRAQERGMDEIEVGVSKDNKKAIKFYLRN